MPPRPPRSSIEPPPPPGGTGVGITYSGGTKDPASDPTNDNAPGSEGPTPAGNDPSNSGGGTTDGSDSGESDDAIPGTGFWSTDVYGNPMWVTDPSAALNTGYNPDGGGMNLPYATNYGWQNWGGSEGGGNYGDTGDYSYFDESGD